MGSSVYILLLIIAASLLLILFIKKGFSSDGQETVAPAAPAEVGRPAHQHGYDGTGIAIFTDKQEVILTNDGLRRAYGYDQIRSWSKRWNTGGKFYYGGSGRPIGQTFLRNRKIEHENRNSSGLFIDVKDINRPQWRVAFGNEQELERWFEILQQELNEVSSDQLPSQAMKDCPYCAEPIRIEAIKCKHCGSMLTPTAEPLG